METRDKRWYVIHTYSGYENKVKTTLELKVQSMGMEDVISQVMVPMEDAIEEKDGVQKIVKRKIFPGYVLVEMEVNDRSWYVVRNTPGVTGFVGSATKPVPLTDAEVQRIFGLQEAKEPVLTTDLAVGETVRITSGVFEGYDGTVSAIDSEKGTIKILVDAFGRETNVELGISEVEAIYE